MNISFSPLCQDDVLDSRAEADEINPLSPIDCDDARRNIQSDVTANTRSSECTRNASVNIHAFTRRSTVSPLPASYVLIPILGTIPAGTPWGQCQEDDGCIGVDISSIGIPNNARTFAVRVCGESMVGAGILDKDVVILEFKSPYDGAVVAALVDGEMTLKRYFLRSGRPFLKAENPRFRAIVPARELVVQGVMVALVRRT